MESLDTVAGAAIYQLSALSLYDMFVLKFSNNHAWRCPTKNIFVHSVRKTYPVTAWTSVSAPDTIYIKQSQPVP